MRVCAVVAAFAEVQQQAAAALQVRQEAASVLRLDTADPGGGGRQVRAAGNLHVAQQALVAGQSVGSGKRVSVRVDPRGDRITKKTTHQKYTQLKPTHITCTKN